MKPRILKLFKSPN